MSYTVWKREHPPSTLFEYEIRITSNSIATKPNCPLHEYANDRNDIYHRDFETVQDIIESVNNKEFEYPIDQAMRVVHPFLHFFEFESICGIYYLGCQDGSSVGNLLYGPLICLRMWVHEVSIDDGSFVVQEPEAFILAANDVMSSVRAKNLYDESHQAELTFDLLNQCRYVGKF